MKTVVYAVLLLIFVSCSNSKSLTQKQQINSTYHVNKIEVKNAWYIIYAVKNDSIYKIVVGMQDNLDENCQKIVEGENYSLELHSRRNNVPDIDGIKLKPVNHLDIQCYSYDEETEICIEPEKGIYDLYYTNSIKGLCYAPSEYRRKKNQ